MKLPCILLFIWFISRILCCLARYFWRPLALTNFPTVFGGFVSLAHVVLFEKLQCFYRDVRTHSVFLTLRHSRSQTTVRVRASPLSVTRSICQTFVSAATRSQTMRTSNQAGRASSETRQATHGLIHLEGAKRPKTQIKWRTNFLCSATVHSQTKGLVVIWGIMVGCSDAGL